MKKNLLLLMFLSFSLLAKQTCKNLLLKDISEKYLKSGVNLEAQDSFDLLFEYEIYQKLIKDLNIKDLLDRVIENAGFIPTDENRMIFFSAISKELRDKIKFSFDSVTGGSNYGNQVNFQNSDMLAYQTEMTRTLTSLLQHVNTKINDNVGVKRKYLIMAVIGAFIASELGFFKKMIGMSHFYMKNKERVVKKVDAFGSWIKRKTDPVTDIFVRKDYASQNPKLKKFVSALKQFKTELYDTQDWHGDKYLGSAEKIVVECKGGESLSFKIPE